jgi:hypothetical protein
MTDPVPGQLLDTCAIINLSYCTPIASAFRSRYEGSAGWVRATQAELIRQRSRRPPHPQAGRASNWAAMWLGIPVEMVDESLFAAASACTHNSLRSTCSQAILVPGCRPAGALVRMSGPSAACGGPSDRLSDASPVPARGHAALTAAAARPAVHGADRPPGKARRAS